ncbi:MAG: hypothetical protein LBT74_13890 [Acidobacteriota bacterium]|jgi:hypothetical protein|nr:hypothetical protein [Acidobacteriota bacterium]
MKLDLSQVSQARVETGRTKATPPSKRPTAVSQRFTAQEADKATLSASMLGPGGTYSISSLKAAAAYQAKYYDVAESNVTAAQSAPRIPDTLRRQFA